MRVSDFLKEEGIKIKRIHFAVAKRDPKNDDFHLIPSPVLTFNKGKLLNLIGFGLKIGFWGIGIGLAYARKDVELTRQQK